MGLEVEVHLKWMRYVTVDDSTGFAVSALVCIVSCLGEESYMMTFTHNDDGYSWVDFQRRARLWSRSQ